MYKTASKFRARIKEKFTAKAKYRFSPKKEDEKEENIVALQNRIWHSRKRVSSTRGKAKRKLIKTISELEQKLIKIEEKFGKKIVIVKKTEKLASVSKSNNSKIDIVKSSEKPIDVTCQYCNMIYPSTISHIKYCKMKPHLSKQSK